MADTCPIREQWLLLLPRTAAIGIIFGFFAAYIGIPLPWMLGGMFGAILFSLCGIRLGMPRPLRQASRVVIGVILGTSIDAETLSRVMDWPASLVLMLSGMSVIVLISALYYVRVAQFDRLTAVSASLPGGLSNLTAVAIRMGADAPATVLGQLFRLTAVVSLFPPLYLFWMDGVAASMAMGAPTVWTGENSWVLLLAILVVPLGRYLHIPEPEMLARMMATAALGMAGFPVALPFWLMATSFIIIGTSIGVQFRGIPLLTLLTKGRHSFLVTVGSLFCTLTLAVLINWVTGVPLHVVLLAVAPGGVAEMAILAVSLGVDPVFVTFHQAFRSVIVNGGAPYLLQRLRNVPPSS